MIRSIIQKRLIRVLRESGQVYRLLSKIEVQRAFFEYEWDVVRNEDYNLP